MIAEGEAIGVTSTGRIMINDSELASRLSALLRHRLQAFSPASTLIRMKNTGFKCTLVRMQSGFHHRISRGTDGGDDHRAAEPAIAPRSQ